MFDLSRVLQEMARVLASESPGSPTSGSPTLRSDMFSVFYPPAVVALLCNLCNLLLCAAC